MSGDPFVTHRSLLLTVACEMLGSAADAEDGPNCVDDHLLHSTSP